MTDIKNLKQIGEGKTALIYEYEEDKILKVFKTWVGMDLINNEKNAAEAAFLRGIPTPKVFELKTAGDFTALVYEKITNKTMEQCLIKDILNAKKYARQMAELHLSIHAVSPAHNIPETDKAYIPFIFSKKSLSAENKQKAADILRSLPDDNKLCHGDFHPQNILYHNGKPYIIDWTGAAAGSPMVDVCGTYLLIKITRTQKKTGKIIHFQSRNK